MKIKRTSQNDKMKKKIKKITKKRSTSKKLVINYMKERKSTLGRIKKLKEKAKELMYETKDKKIKFKKQRFLNVDEGVSK